MDFQKDMALTQRTLDAIAVRAKVALHNVANASTPGYKRYYVTFEAELRTAMESGKSVVDVHPKVHRDGSGGPGQNNVSIMDELALLDKIKLLHEVFTRKAGGYFAKLNKAIRGS